MSKQLVIVHADGSESIYAITDASVLTVDGMSVSLATVAEIRVDDSPVEIVPPTAPEQDAVPEQPAPPAQPDPVAQEAATQPAAPTDPSQPAATPDGSQP